MATKTLGGDRLHSGNKMKVELKAYERSTHNLNKNWKSSIAPGVLYPCYWAIAVNGDTWDIDINAAVKTVPTIAPLFGKFKYQVDFFSVPMRLYQGLLHNNARKIGLEMNKVLLPQLSQRIKDTTEPVKPYTATSLAHYLKLRGMGTAVADNSGGYDAKREFFGIPFLAYYDIFKNYFAFQQEDKAYMIGDLEYGEQIIDNYIPFNEGGYAFPTYGLPKDSRNGVLSNAYNSEGKEYFISGWRLNGENMNAKNIYIKVNGDIEGFANVWGDDYHNLLWWGDQGINNPFIISPKGMGLNQIIIEKLGDGTGEGLDKGIAWGNLIQIKWDKEALMNKSNSIKLEPFPLDNIDKMRYDILRNAEMLEKITFGDEGTLDYPPFNKLTYNNLTKLPMLGLVVKTYRSDMFNNWLSEEWINTINEISSVTAVSAESGSFTMDALTLAKKVYNMLNMIAVSGGTYEDYQEAKWGVDVTKRTEKPVYEGGVSYNVGFEEVVSTADTDTSSGGDQPLGSLAGKGEIYNKKGGKITIKVNEPSIIMGICHLTPEISYSQGNYWGFDIKTIDDLHSPEMDGIGFQDMILERLAWWTTYQKKGDLGEVYVNEFIKQSGGKQPAWLHYTTDIDENHGDFAEENKAQFMVLDRKYERDEDLISIKDLSPYIDPSKYNYAFAQTNLEAQNFWVQNAFNITCRRKMSAKLIPYLL